MRDGTTTRSCAAPLEPAASSREHTVASRSVYPRVMATTESHEKPTRERSVRRFAWAAAIALFAVVIASTAIPMRIIHPFRAQTAAGISLSYHAHALGSVVAPIAALVLAALTMWLWRGARRWRRPCSC